MAAFSPSQFHKIFSSIFCSSNLDLNDMNTRFLDSCQDLILTTSCSENEMVESAEIAVQIFLGCLFPRTLDFWSAHPGSRYPECCLAIKEVLRISDLRITDGFLRLKLASLNHLLYVEDPVVACVLQVGPAMDLFDWNSAPPCTLPSRPRYDPPSIVKRPAAFSVSGSPIEAYVPRAPLPTFPMPFSQPAYSPRVPTPHRPSHPYPPARSHSDTEIHAPSGYPQLLSWPQPTPPSVSPSSNRDVGSGFQQPRPPQHTNFQFTSPYQRLPQISPTTHRSSPIHHSDLTQNALSSLAPPLRDVTPKHCRPSHHRALSTSTLSSLSPLSSSVDHSPCMSPNAIPSPDKSSSTLMLPMDSRNSPSNSASASASVPISLEPSFVFYSPSAKKRKKRPNNTLMASPNRQGPSSSSHILSTSTTGDKKTRLGARSATFSYADENEPEAAVVAGTKRKASRSRRPSVVDEDNMPLRRSGRKRARTDEAG